MQRSEVLRIVKEELDASQDALQSLFNKATSVKEKQIYLDKIIIVDSIRSRIIERVLSGLGTDLSVFLNSCNEKDKTSEMVK